MAGPGAGRLGRRRGRTSSSRPGSRPLDFLLLVDLSGTVSAWTRSPRIRRRLDGLTGVVVLGFGIRLAPESFA